jgi:hypothetical protein
MGDSSLEAVAAAVGSALERAGIRAVLTGGGCATIYTKGEYQSEDLDFVLQSSTSQSLLDQAMASIGFQRRGDRYHHPKSRFFVEFPLGPLGIGRDLDLKPLPLKIGQTRILALSATDSCRDRLAAFFFWNDRQSLETAVQIALRKTVDLKAVSAWAISEGMADRLEEFTRALASARGEKPKRRRPRRKPV